MEIREQKHSENEFINELRIMMGAGVSLIHIRTRDEILRALECIRANAIAEKARYIEWDVLRGSREFTLSNFQKPHEVKGDNNIDIIDAISKVSSHLSPSNVVQEDSNNTLAGMSFFVFVNPQYWWNNNPSMHQLVMEYSAILNWSHVKLLFITPDIALPEDISSLFRVISFVPPSQQERLESVDLVMSYIESGLVDITEEDKSIIAFAGSGLSRTNFELYTSTAIMVSASELPDDSTDAVTVDHITKGIGVGKMELIKKNDLLELYPTESMSNVGGLDTLKDWVRKRKKCYSTEAEEFGVAPPRGIVLTGLAGSGKTSVSKSIAYEFGVPLVKLDFGKVYSSLVGSSEQRVRTALATIEAISPVCVLLDECEKGLSGSSGGGDSGVSARVLGTFLTWMQDHKAPVFVIMTSNNIQYLPPELLRKGRMDAIFFTLFPTQSECLDILNIHLNKRGWRANSFPLEERMEVARYAEEHKYVAAEIEEAVKDALIECFTKGINLNMDEVLTSLANTVPMSVMHSDRIDALIAWGEQNAISASSEKKKRVNYSAKPIETSRGGSRRKIMPVSTRNIKKLN